MWLAQPAEELIAGARTMLQDGLYDRFGTPDIVLGQHVIPSPTENFPFSLLITRGSFMCITRKLTQLSKAKSLRPTSGTRLLPN